MFKKQGYGYDKSDRLSEMASWREKAKKVLKNTSKNTAIEKMKETRGRISKAKGYGEK